MCVACTIFCVVQVVLLLVCVVIRDSYTAGRLVLAASGVKTSGFLDSLVLRSFLPDPVYTNCGAVCDPTLGFHVQTRCGSDSGTHVHWVSYRCGKVRRSGSFAVGRCISCVSGKAHKDSDYTAMIANAH